MSLSFTGSAYSNSSSNFLVSLSNQTGGITLNVPPSANFLARFYLYQGSNATGRASNVQFSFGDTIRNSVNIDGNTISYYNSSNLLASCNISPVFNSNVEVGFMDDITGIRVYYNKLPTISYFSSNFSFSSNANFKWNASNASSNTLQINNVSIEPIFTFVNNATFAKSLRCMNTIVSSNIQSSNISSMSNYLYSLSNSVVTTNLNSSNITVSNLYFTSNTLPIIVGSNSSLITTIGNTSNDYYKISKVGNVDVFTILSGATNVGTFAGTLNATDLQESGISLLSKYALSNTLSNFLLTTNANTQFAPSNVLGNYLPIMGGNITGNLGIGAVSPSKNIHIYNATNEVGLRVEGGSNGTSNNAQVYFVARSNRPICIGHYNQSLYIGRSTNGGDVTGTTQPTIVCTTGDNVGIGTSNPTYKLDVNGTFNATTIYENSNSLSNKYASLSGYTSLSNYAYNLSTSNSVIQNIYTSNINATNGGTIGALFCSAASLGVAGYALFNQNGQMVNAFADAASAGAKLNLDPNAGLISSLTSQFSYSRFTDAIDIGIMTLTLSNNQIFFKNSNTSNAVMGSNNLTIMNNQPFNFSTSNQWIYTGSTIFNNEVKFSGSKLYMYNTDNSNAYHGLSIGAAQLQICTASSNNNIGFGYTSCNSFYEKMRIGGNGYVGINTNNPSTELEVNGGVKANTLTSSNITSSNITSTSLSSSTISSSTLSVGSCAISGGSFTMADFGTSSSFTTDIFAY